MTGPERREQILDTTKTLVGERGFHGISIDLVARESGISRPVVYRHFDDLTGLLHALVEREGARAVEQLMALLPKRGEGKPRQILLDGLRAFLEAVRDEPVTWRLVLVPPEGTPEVLRERAVLVRRGVTDQLAALAPEILGSGDELPDPELTALTMQATSEDGARLILDDPERYPIERIVAHADWMLGRLGL